MTTIDLLADSASANTRCYRIGDVARYVGVSTHALRAWERRYGTVEPQRTPGGSRLYDAAQIDRLKTLKDLTDYGHSIGEIAKLSLAELKRLLTATLDLSESK
ncbi:MAG TPA: MerR family transcriptional regulator [Polyangiaceae bacterium]|nr:MerR family transcriptional regulator [Polyangiaceae bacterium]